MRTLLLVSLLALSAAAAAAQPPDENLPAAPGKDLFAARCSTCHGLGRVTMYKRTKAQWSDTVAAMLDKGLELTDAEAADIVSYLTATLPPPPDEK